MDIVPIFIDTNAPDPLRRCPSCGRILRGELLSFLLIGLWIVPVLVLAAVVFTCSLNVVFEWVGGKTLVEAFVNQGHSIVALLKRLW